MICIQAYLCKGYIHCDLAARNVFVSTQKTVKVGDFGMCRALNNKTLYTTRTGKLPIKWMAIESLQESKFTEYTDVYVSHMRVFFNLFVFYFQVVIWRCTLGDVVAWRDTVSLAGASSNARTFTRRPSSRTASSCRREHVHHLATIGVN